MNNMIKKMPLGKLRIYIPQGQQITVESKSFRGLVQATGMARTYKLCEKRRVNECHGVPYANWFF